MYLSLLCLGLAGLGGVLWALVQYEESEGITELGAVLREFSYVCLGSALVLAITASFIR